MSPSLYEAYSDEMTEAGMSVACVTRDSKISLNA
jgi:hypothetical protein